MKDQAVGGANNTGKVVKGKLAPLAHPWFVAAEQLNDARFSSELRPVRPPHLYARQRDVALRQPVPPHRVVYLRPQLLRTPRKE